MNKKQNFIAIVLGSALALALLLTYNRWKSAKATLPTAKVEMPANMGGMPQEPVDRVAFFSALFDKSKPPANIARLLLSDPKLLSSDSLKPIKKWATETQNHALLANLELEEFNLSKKGDLTSIARNLIFTGTEFSEQPQVGAYLFQQGKILIDKGLAQNPKNMDLRNALIVYQSEYLNQPMQFLATLKESLLIDSMNVELHFIHYNLLKKSQQWEKAIKKCQKLVSLQPQNPYWLFEMSNVYGTLGDSLNAKTYLDLAVKAQRKQGRENKN